MDTYKKKTKYVVNGNKSLVGYAISNNRKYFPKIKD